jgi:hypothetical protein
MISVPTATYSEDIYTFSWSDEGIHAVVERFVEEKTDIRAELTITSDHPANGGQLYYGRLLLMGPQARAQVRNALLSRDPDMDWGAMLEQLCTASVRRYREGAPAVDLWTAELGDAGKYLVSPFLFDNAVNIIYGPGDSGKSLTCLLLSAAVATGEEIAGLVAERSGPVLYLDWEDSAETHQERLKALCEGLGLSMTEGMMIYRRMDASLVEGAREARKDIAKFGAVMVVVDSLGMACGGDPSDAGGIIRTMLAARSLGVPVVCIHHIAKDAKDKSTPYGSVYASNEARMSWMAESEREGSRLTQVLTNYKANRGARHERQSFRFDFLSDERERLTRISVTPLTFTQSKAVGGGGQKWRIADVLKTPKTIDQIAELVDITKSTTRMQLNRHKDIFTKLEDGRWALLDTRGGAESTDTNQGESVIQGESNHTRPFMGPDTTPDTEDGEAEEEGAPW